MDPEFLKEINFPHETVRPIQADMIKDVHDTVSTGGTILMHAPTGIGKTASALAPALRVAIDKKLTVFFLTSRHTQHHIVIETIKAMKKKHGVNLVVADMVGKKGMCSQPGIEALYSGEFHDYCKKLREEDQCHFYLNTRKQGNQLTTQAKKAVIELELVNPCHVEEVNAEGKRAKLCAYELALELGRKAQIVVGDYYYLFNESIRNSYLQKLNKKLEDVIIVVDEAHNLPSRVRSLSSQQLSTFVLDRAIEESRKMGKEDITHALEQIKLGFDTLLNFSTEERLVGKEEVIKIVKSVASYDDLVADLLVLGEEVQTMQKRSYCSTVSKFLDLWGGPEEGYVRVLTKLDKGFKVTYQCLDPSLMTKEVFDEAYASVIMSGTLKPTEMYKDLLGVGNAQEKEYANPFPDENRLTMIVPKTTTKFTARSEHQFKDIAVMCSGIIDSVPGNTAVFFPSYYVRDQVVGHLEKLVKRRIYTEKPGATKEAKKQLIGMFCQEKEGVLLGVSTGSFGEGLDLPGILKGVIVVGLPLTKPDLETKSLIDYYQQKFGKGWEYGYINPAMTACFQNAGRCIRSEKDKGVIVFLDERYAWKNYLGCFPSEWDMKIQVDYVPLLDKFFGKKKQETLKSVYDL